MTVPALPRVVLVGLGFALVLVAYTACLFALSLVVRSQGLPQDDDPVATMSVEATLVIRLVLFGLLLAVGFVFGMFGFATWLGFGW